jgi:hypothetical protein
MGTDPLYPSKYVAVCAAYGTTKGTTATLFAPGDDITRQQLITMVVRAAGLSEPPTDYDPDFSAAQLSTSEHYKNARIAAYHKILYDLQGVGPTYDFSPRLRAGNAPSCSTLCRCYEALHAGA